MRPTSFSRQEILPLISSDEDWISIAEIAHVMSYFKYKGIIFSKKRCHLNSNKKEF